VIRCRAFRQEKEQQHYSLPASAVLCNIHLPDVDYVPSSLPTLLGVMELRLTMLSLLGGHIYVRMTSRLRTHLHIHLSHEDGCKIPGKQACVQKIHHMQTIQAGMMQQE